MTQGSHLGRTLRRGLLGEDCLEGKVWRGQFGEDCLERTAWRGLFGEDCLERAVWRGLFGEDCLERAVWRGLVKNSSVWHILGTMLKGRIKLKMCPPPILLNISPCVTRTSCFHKVEKYLLREIGGTMPQYALLVLTL